MDRMRYHTPAVGLFRRRKRAAAVPAAKPGPTGNVLRHCTDRHHHRHYVPTRCHRRHVVRSPHRSDLPHPLRRHAKVKRHHQPDQTFLTTAHVNHPVVTATAAVAQDAVTAAAAAEISEFLMPGSQVKRIAGPVIHMPDGKMFEVTVAKKQKQDRLPHRPPFDPFDPQFAAAFDAGFGIPDQGMKTAAAYSTRRSFHTSSMNHLIGNETITLTEEFEFKFDEDQDPFTGQAGGQENDDDDDDQFLDEYLGEEERDPFEEVGSPFGDKTTDDQELDVMFDSLLHVRPLFNMVPKVSHLNDSYDLLHEAAGISGVNLTSGGIRKMVKQRRRAAAAGREPDESASGGNGLTGRRGDEFQNRLMQKLFPFRDGTGEMDKPIAL